MGERTQGLQTKKVLCYPRSVHQTYPSSWMFPATRFLPPTIFTRADIRCIAQSNLEMRQAQFLAETMPQIY